MSTFAKRAGVLGFTLLLAIIGTGFGCSSNDLVSEEKTSTVPEKTSQEQFVEPNFKVLDDNTIRYFLAHNTLQFDTKKGWTIERSSEFEIAFKRETENGVARLAVAFEKERDPYDAVKNRFTGTEITPLSYKDDRKSAVFHGTDPFYYVGDGGAGSGGMFAERLGNNVVSVYFFTHGVKGFDESDFHRAIASLRQMEAE